MKSVILLCELFLMMRTTQGFLNKRGAVCTSFDVPLPAGFVSCFTNIYRASEFGLSILCPVSAYYELYCRGIAIF